MDGDLILTVRAHSRKRTDTSDASHNQTGYDDGNDNFTLLAFQLGIITDILKVLHREKRDIERRSTNF